MSPLQRRNLYCSVMFAERRQTSGSTNETTNFDVCDTIKESLELYVTIFYWWKRCVHQLYDGIRSFPGWLLSRMVFSPERRFPGGHFPGWSFSPYETFPRKTSWMVGLMFNCSWRKSYRTTILRIFKWIYSQFGTLTNSSQVNMGRVGICNL